MGKKRLEQIFCDEGKYYRKNGQRVSVKVVPHPPIVFLCRNTLIDSVGYYKPIINSVRLEEGLIDRANAYVLTISMYDEITSLSAQLYKI